MATTQRLDLSTLNPSQQEAVCQTEGPLVVYAGAGSGKTRVICYRIAYLVESGVPPSSIMAVTFTNKATREMKERIESLVGIRSRSILVSTFHSACARFLRIFAREAGYTEGFSIYDDDEQKTLLKDVLRELDVPEKFLSLNTLKYRIDALKNQGESPEDFLRRIRTANQTSEKLGRSLAQRFGEEEHEEIIQKCYALYQKKLISQNAMDFNDLLLVMVQLLQQRPDVLAQLQDRYHYFLVDEFQDTNPIQFQLISLLSSHTGNLCIVGDDDQSIYSWRGAEPSFIMNFAKTFPNARTVKLEQNYRSTGSIVRAALGIISHNVKRAEKSLWTEEPTGEPILVRKSQDPQDEANAICQNILKHVDGGAKYSEFGILYRTNAQSRALEDALRRRMLPYVIYGSVRFYERAEIKVLLAYLKLLVNADDDASFQKVIQTPRRGFGDKALLKLKQVAAQEQTSLAKIASRIAHNEFGADIGRGQSALKEITQLFIRWHGMLQTQGSLAHLLSDIISTIKFEEYIRVTYPDEFDDRWLNVLELKNALSDYETRSETPTSEGNEHSVQDPFEGLNSMHEGYKSQTATPARLLTRFLEEAALTVEPNVRNVQAGSTDAITLMTIHSSKGLEFDRVYLSGLEEGILPHNNSLENDASIEEERRLMYVAITRARRHLMICYITRNRFRPDFPAMPSRFLAEIPAECVELIRPDYDRWGTRGSNSSGSKPPLSVVPNRNAAPLIQKADALLNRSQEAGGVEWRMGLKVRHKVFGVGTVQNVEKSLDGYRLEVRFPIVGVKKLLHTYVTPV